MVKFKCTNFFRMPLFVAESLQFGIATQTYYLQAEESVFVQGVGMAGMQRGLVVWILCRNFAAEYEG